MTVAGTVQLRSLAVTATTPMVRPRLLRRGTVTVTATVMVILPDTRVQCATPAGYIRTGGDCNDSDRSVYPTAPELCDGMFNDCADGSYNALGAPAIETDNDSDGYSSVRLTPLVGTVRRDSWR